MHVSSMKEPDYVIIYMYACSYMMITDPLTKSMSWLATVANVSLHLQIYLQLLNLDASLTKPVSSGRVKGWLGNQGL